MLQPPCPADPRRAEALLRRPPSAAGFVLLALLWCTVAAGLIGRMGAPPAPVASPPAVARGEVTLEPWTPVVVAGSAATFPPAIPRLVAADDPTGDVRFSASGPCIAPPSTPPPSIDITGLAAWIADGALHAEVTLAGRPPAPGDPGTLVRLSVGQAGAWLEAPLCTSAALCGAPRDLLPFTSALRQWASLGQASEGWAVDYAVPLREVTTRLGVARPPDVYDLLAASSVIEADGIWTDLAPEGRPPLQVHRAP